ncbi:hypothetical protein M501DRAFT_999960 [Patellaria atrata CBS 101060]|uniref:Nucleotide-diphospho-sugar transferase domain-containing protein n=1 Tax=Patellaria atrata CBS 101060 TaxID=1346257 RepID=A0A9P4S1S1_9PEZI|nr:hypothetical protein M501DRAFT_999960 [Patellaria atrata CBS 101060]
MVMNVSRVDWSRINRLSAGMLNHYMYAEIHGYDYKFIRGVNYNDRHGTWVKPAAIAQVLPEYDFVVFLDADAIFPHLEIPIEWLLNYWRISPQISAALALDPPLKVNDDVHGHTMLNTGFVIFQNNEKTREIVKDWEECPTDTKYPTCSNWTYKWAHEQSAFSNFIRYDHPENVMELPCAEANGAPQAKHMGGCTGTFVQHFWVNKDLVPSMVAKSIMNVLMDRLHGQYLDNVKEIYVEGSNATYSIAASKELD